MMPSQNTLHSLFPIFGSISPPPFLHPIGIKVPGKNNVTTVNIVMSALITLYNLRIIYLWRRSPHWKLNFGEECYKQILEVLILAKKLEFLILVLILTKKIPGARLRKPIMIYLFWRRLYRPNYFSMYIIPMHIVAKQILEVPILANLIWSRIIQIPIPILETNANFGVTFFL